MARRKTTDALEILHKRFVNTPDAVRDLEEARASLEVAAQIHSIRKEVGLTQKQLAELVGTSHSVISRLENDDYQGHSLPMLRRIAAALGRRVEIRFPPLRDPQAT